MAYNDVPNGSVLYNVAWESIGSHGHTQATRDGQALNYGNCFGAGGSLSVHNHQSIASGGGLDFGTCFSTSLIPQFINSHLINYIGRNGINPSILNNQKVSSSFETTATGVTSITFGSVPTVYWVAGGRSLVLQSRPVSSLSAISNSNSYFSYETMLAHDTFANTSGWSKYSGSASATISVSDNSITLSSTGNGTGATYQYDNLNLGAMTVGRKYSFVFKCVNASAGGHGTVATFQLGTPGGSMQITQTAGDGTTLNTKIDLVATAVDKADIYINGEYSNNYTFANLDKVMMATGTDLANVYVTIFLFGYSGASATTYTKAITFDQTNWETITNILGYKTPTNAGTAASLKLTSTTDVAEVGFIYGYSVQVV